MVVWSPALWPVPCLLPWRGSLPETPCHPPLCVLCAAAEANLSKCRPEPVVSSLSCCRMLPPPQHTCFIPPQSHPQPHCTLPVSRLHVVHSSSRKGASVCIPRTSYCSGHRVGTRWTLGWNDGAKSPVELIFCSSKVIIQGLYGDFWYLVSGSS